MKTLPWSIAIVSLLLSASCRAPAEQRVPFPAQDVTVTHNDVTRIYFMRGGYVGAQRKEIVVLDAEQEIGTLLPGTYLCWERPAGRTLGQAFYKSADPLRGNLEGIADLDCAAGQAYYYMVTVLRDDGKPEVELLSPEEGRKLIAERKPAKQAE
jgi:hypothetical protein